MGIREDIAILLVEDAVTMRKIEVKALRALGFANVTEAEDGRAAQEILRRPGQRFDLVISDWNMPNLGGYDLLVWMRQQEDFQTLPFLMATGQSDRSQAQAALEAGANGLIAKPFGAGELKEKMEEAMGQCQSGGRPTATASGPQMGASGKVRLRLAHIQITDHLILGVLKHWIEKGEVTPQHFELETQCLPGWNQVQQALEAGTVDGACILAPIAMELFHFGAAIKVVLFAHRGGSICVRSRQGAYAEPYQDFFRRRSFLIPHKLSVHHLLTHMFFEGVGLKASQGKGPEVEVNLEVVAPIDMPEFLKDNEDSCGFMVAEPLGTKAIAAGIADLQFLSGELWANHPCCVVAIRDDFAEPHRKAVYELTELLVKAGKFIEKRPDTAAEIAVAFLDPGKKLGLKVPVLKNVLREPQGIKTGDLYPAKEDLNRMQRYLHDKMGIGALVDLDQLVDLRYADAACAGQARMAATLMSPGEAMGQLLCPRGQEADAAKSMLAKEGRYLTFKLGPQEFGINILKIKEIVKMMAFVKVHQAPAYAKGVLNLRDRVVPIIDLRAKLGMEEIAYHDRSCIVIVETEHEAETRRMGVVVDSVSEVVTFKAAEIEGPSSLGLGAGIDTRCLLGLAKSGPQVKILLDIDQTLR